MRVFHFQYGISVSTSSWLKEIASPQAKRHMPSLLFTCLTILTSLTFIQLACFGAGCYNETSRHMPNPTSVLFRHWNTFHSFHALGFFPWASCWSAATHCPCYAVYIALQLLDFLFVVESESRFCQWILSLLPQMWFQRSVAHLINKFYKQSNSKHHHQDPTLDWLFDQLLT